jgi:FMN phosphatase YigB (HAD superfamily)
MIKRYFVWAALMCSLVITGIHTYQCTNIKEILTPSTPGTSMRNVVVWLDIHQVLVKLNRLQAVSAFINGAWSPRLWYNFSKNLRNKIPSELAFIKALEQRKYSTKNQAKYLNKFTSMCNKQKLDEEFIDLLEELKSHGVKFYINSNIGANTYKELIRIHPKIANIVSGPNHVVTPEANHPVKKPDHRAFERSINQMKENGDFNKNTLIIFIDDNRRNISASEAFGQQHNLDLRGIICRNSKQAIRDLRHILDQEANIPNSNSIKL